MVVGYVICLVYLNKVIDIKHSSFEPFCGLFNLCSYKCGAN